MFDPYSCCSVDEIMSGTGRQEVYLCVPPFVHCYGLVIVLLFGLAQGYKLVTVKRFYLDEYLAAIQKYKVNISRQWLAILQEN